MSSSTHAPIHTHPDIVALRERYTQVAQQPPAQITDGTTMLSGLYAATSAWIVSGVNTSTAMIWSNSVVGALVCVLGLDTAAMGTGPRLLRRESRGQ